MASTIEGYLYSFGPSRQGGIYCFLTFCVLSRRQFSQLRLKGDLVPLRSGLLDLDHRLEDTGRQVVNGKILYTIRLYSITDPKKEVLLGAVSSEEVAEWLKAFTFSLGKPLDLTLEPWSPSLGIQLAYLSENLVGDGRPRESLGLQPHLPRNGKHIEKSYTSLTTIGHDSPFLAESFGTAGMGDFQSASPSSTPKWRLVRCENGLRFFEEISSEFPFRYKLPVMKAVGVVKAPADQIFGLIMDYGSERVQWDNTVESASVSEVIDGHSDVLHICLRQDWMWLRPRDFCLYRYWMREDNGTYSVFYRSVHKPLQPGFVRAYIHSGGYIVTPLKSSASGKPRTLVESVLEMDVAGWSSLVGNWLSAYPVHLRDSLLSVVAGIREHVAAQRVNSSVTVVKRHIEEFMEDHLLPDSLDSSEAVVTVTPFLSTEDLEEFHDANMEQLSEGSEVLVLQGSFDIVSESLESSNQTMTLEAGGVTLSPLRCRVYGPRVWEAISNEEMSLCFLWRLEEEYLPVDDRATAPTGDFDWSRVKGSLGRGPLQGGRHCFSEPQGSNFLLRGSNFLVNGSRVAAGEPMCKLVAVDWLKANGRMDHVAGHPHSLVQKVGASNGDIFFFVVNLQVPYSMDYSLVFYFATTKAITEGSLIRRFIVGDDTFRNSRLSLIPAVPEGSWIIKQAVGVRTVQLGQILEANYHVGLNHLEVDVNLGSSGVVRGVMGLVFGYITALVVDLAFFVRGETEEELPEHLLGVVRCSHLQLNLAVPLVPLPVPPLSHVQKGTK